MARTPSTMLPLGTKAPLFRLPDTQGNLITLDHFLGSKLLLVAFISNHCPYVHHIRESFARMALDFAPRGLAVVAINANDPVAYPDDSPEKMVEEKARWYSFPYLFDATQKVAKAYRAACTPDFFLFDSQRELIYRGQYDDSRPFNREPVDGAHLKRAVELALQGGTIPDKEQVPSLGCNIKWRRGNE